MSLGYRLHERGPMRSHWIPKGDESVGDHDCSQHDAQFEHIWPHEFALYKAVCGAVVTPFGAGPPRFDLLCARCKSLASDEIEAAEETTRGIVFA